MVLGTSNHGHTLICETFHTGIKVGHTLYVNHFMHVLMFSQFVEKKRGIKKVALEIERKLRRKNRDKSSCGR